MTIDRVVLRQVHAGRLENVVKHRYLPIITNYNIHTALRYLENLWIVLPMLKIGWLAEDANV